MQLGLQSLVARDVRLVGQPVVHGARKLAVVQGKLAPAPTGRVLSPPAREEAVAAAGKEAVQRLDRSIKEFPAVRGGPGLGVPFEYAPVAASSQFQVSG